MFTNQQLGEKFLAKSSNLPLPLGRELLGRLEGVALDLGCSRVRLDSSDHLGEAIALYRSTGYREINAYNDNPYAVLWFEKALF